MRIRSVRSISSKIALISLTAIPLLYLSNYQNELLNLWLILIATTSTITSSLTQVYLRKAMIKRRASYHFDEQPFHEVNRIKDKNWGKFYEKTLAK
jgi:predicted transcriptional regulator